MAAKRILPLLDRILVRKFKPLDKTASGILIPEKAQEKITRAEVLAVGPGSEEYKMQLKVGDRVMLPSYGGQVVKFEGAEMEGEEVMLFRESEVLAKLQE